MTKLSPSQKLRIRLMFIFKSDNHGYDEFEDFYQAIHEAIHDNLEEFIKLAF